MAKILFTDDDQNFSMPFVFYLEGLGHDCCIAETSAEGIQIVYETNYGIIFLSVFLPDSCGLEKIGEFKRYSGDPEIFIVTEK